LASRIDEDTRRVVEDNRKAAGRREDAGDVRSFSERRNSHISVSFLMDREQFDLKKQTANTKNESLHR
jgi:hypothetical protein